MSNLKRPATRAVTMLESRWRVLILFILTGFIMLSLAGCNTGSESSNSDGEIIIGLTDAEGDHATYTVDVMSLTLTRADGVVVETLPLNTRVDFAQYTELTEFLTAATVPSGVYTSAAMVLDYSNADIRVEDGSGNIVPVTNIIDLDGNTIETLSMSVQLEVIDKLLIAPGIPAHLTLDFDLKASNRVDFSGAEPVLTVAPYLVADVELEEPKVHRVRGPLASVDVDANQFEIIMRPFFHRFLREGVGEDRRFGTLDVSVDDNTYYEINGVMYQGIAGLSELSVQPRFTATIALGDLRRVNNRFVFIATQVLAGSSVPYGDDDVASGHVVARSGDTVELKGVTLYREDGTVIFNDTVFVELAASTQVTKQLSAADHSISEISVGQRLTVFGVLTGDAGSGYTLDATDGMARMHLTTLRGVVEQTDSPLAVDVDYIGRRSIELFDFSGTGVDVANDANPDFYEINTGTLDLSGIVVNEPVKVRGLVREFGQAPEDFDAQSLVLVADAKALMMVNWSPASNAAISEIDADHMTLDLDGAGRFHHVVRASILTDLTGFANSPVLIPNTSNTGVFVITGRGAALVFTDFSRFINALDRYLRNGARVKTIKAKGRFDDNSVNFTVRGMRVRLR